MTESAAHSTSPRLVVVGSLNVDSTSYVGHFPAPGETVESTGFAVALGGKGTNQAVAAHLAGVETELIARVGTDSSGDFALSTLAQLGVATNGIQRIADVTTGVAQITVAASGENTVIVTAGANGLLGPELGDAETAAIAAASLVLTQGEIPAATVEALAASAAAAGTRYVLNLAPPVAVAPAALAVCDPLVVNEHEARAVGLVPDAAADDSLSAEQWQQLAASAVAAGRCRSLVITLGSAGAVAADASGSWHRQAPRVTPVDTTGAGDCFTGTLAAFLAEGRSLAEATGLAAAAGALSVQARGTVGSYAPRAAVLAFAAEHALA
ncbi:ribokinase [Microterricola gilva]|uniref:Ribokinase n=1 Tax=Microterricola gilva TaxID=393267 RepID=A0A4Q8AHD0_9MICO|nr:ribokinase [Microterricola gilva]RZU63810.1 ribokinase [Microterricola gilva]